MPQPARQLLVWPLWQRLLHGGLALSVFTALFTHEGGGVHETAGYAALALAGLRVAAGLWGPTPARFAAFVRRPRDTWAYAQQVWRHTEARHINHNPLGAWMVVLLLAMALLGAGSGALYVTDAFWGLGWVITLHALACWALLPLVALHLAGVLHASRRQRENLAAAMWHGRKPEAVQQTQQELPPTTGPSG